ncbi:hypothetical protein [Andreprevotia chitinilytica]|uniref:hypothetical protein n=1 Tax=Andreprevotia chitinilytica TaxID=396808 RepID=UPI0005501369|nr:hypothetical protein [Andreprevotia chitinilytica]
MKPILQSALLSTLLSALLVTGTANAEDVRITVRFANPAWNGLVIPPGQQCSKLGGQGATPALNVYDLPTGTAALLLEFSERGGPLDEGGQGVLLFNVMRGVTNAQLPSVPGQQPLPAGFQLASSHRGEGAAGYLPPCNKGSRYVVIVKALDTASKVLGKGRLDLGKL